MGVHSDHRAARLKRRLLSKFGERIKFIPGLSVTDPEGVVSANVPMDVLFQAACAASGSVVGQGCEQRDGNSDVDSLAELHLPIQHSPAAV